MFEITILLASLGLILATVSFISGFQALRIRRSVDTRIHRLNGYLMFFAYLFLAGLSFVKGGINLSSIASWGTGLTIILTKIWIVRRGKAYKFGSWLGIMLIITWLIIVYTYIPI